MFILMCVLCVVHAPAGAAPPLPHLLRQRLQLTQQAPRAGAGLAAGVGVVARQEEGGQGRGVQQALQQGVGKTRVPGMKGAAGGSRGGGHVGVGAGGRGWWDERQGG